MPASIPSLKLRYIQCTSQYLPRPAGATYPDALRDRDRYGLVHRRLAEGVALSTEGLPKVGLWIKKTSFAVCFSGEKFAFVISGLNMGESCRVHTMYIQNRRDISNFKGCSPLQNCNGLTCLYCHFGRQVSLGPAIAYFAYTKRLPTSLKEHRTNENLMKRDKKRNGKASPQPNEVSSRIPLNINLSMSKSKSVAALHCNSRSSGTGCPFTATHNLSRILSGCFFSQPTCIVQGF
jgi:hypothetical protein